MSVMGRQIAMAKIAGTRTAGPRNQNPMPAANDHIGIDQPISFAT